MRNYNHGDQWFKNYINISGQECLYLRFALFWVVTRRSDISVHTFLEKPIGTIFRGQAVQELAIHVPRRSVVLWTVR